MIILINNSSIPLVVLRQLHPRQQKLTNHPENILIHVHLILNLLLVVSLRPNVVPKHLVHVQSLHLTAEVGLHQAFVPPQLKRQTLEPLFS